MKNTSVNEMGVCSHWQRYANRASYCNCVNINNVKTIYTCLNLAVNHYFCVTQHKTRKKIMNVRKVILDALKEKFSGVDEKVLNRIARNGAKTVKDEDEAKAFVEDLTLQEVIDSYKDSCVSEALGTYEKKHGLKDGKPIDGDGKTDEPKADEPDDEPKPKTDDGKDNKDGMPSWAKQIMEGQTRLNERLDSFEKGKAADVRKSRFQETIKDAPEKFRQRAEKAFNRCTFKDDEDFTSYLEELAEEAEEARSEAETQGATVTPPKGGNKGGSEYKPSEAMKARAERNKAEATTSVIQGLPANAK